MDSEIKQKIWRNQYFYLGLVIVIIVVSLVIFSQIQLGASARKAEEYNKKILVRDQGLRNRFSYPLGQKKYEWDYSRLSAEKIWQIYPHLGDLAQKNNFLVSWNNEAQTFDIKEPLNLTDYQYLVLDLTWSASKDVETGLPPEIGLLKLQLGDSQMNNYYEYPIFNLKPNRNLIKINKDQFILNKEAGSVFDGRQVELIRLTLVSRPKSFAQLEINKLHLEKDQDYLKEWNLNNNLFLSLERDGFDKIRLGAQNVEGGYMATLKRVENAQNFIYQARISPQKTGRSGLFFRGDYRSGFGYYLYIGGKDSNTWQLVKSNLDSAKILDKGEIKYNYFKVSQAVWLRVEARGSSLTGYISFDGQSFQEIVKVHDDEFPGGGVGIAVVDGSRAYFDEFRFWQ